MIGGTGATRRRLAAAAATGARGIRRAAAALRRPAPAGDGQAADRTQNFPKLEKLEAASIASVSFVPNKEEIDYLIVASKHAEDNRKAGYEARTPKLSKFIDKTMLVPETLKPNDTILAKLGRGAAERGGRGGDEGAWGGAEGFGDGGTIGDKERLTVIPDGPMPLLETSNGPNGVLTDCKNRINLFHENKEQTKNLLEEYLNLRNENIRELFNLHVTKMGDSLVLLDDQKLQSMGIHQEVKRHYNNVVAMMSQINNHLKQDDRSTLSELGIGVVSYCQSWLRRGHPLNGHAHFSVMSPHFQTRFYIKSDDTLAQTCNIQDQLLDSYRFIIERFTDIMQDGYGTPLIKTKYIKNGQFNYRTPTPAFIHLDGLAEYMNLNIADEAAVKLRRADPPPAEEEKM